jgi:hypothetical protein
LIKIEPLGGLGNQLFVYSVGLANSRRLGVELVVDLRNYAGYDWHDYELASFQNAISHESRHRIPLRLLNFISKLTRKLERIRFLESLGASVRETENQFDSRFLDVADGAHMKGYFQSWKYLQPIAGELRESLWALTNPSSWFTEKKEEFDSKGPWTGVHVRLGNYQTLPSMGTVPQEYYQRGLALLSELGHNLPIVVFSDSPKVASEMGLWKNLSNVSFFDSGPANSPLETLLLMSRAEHLIIGNSTFSWWAGWIGHESNRRVIYPRPWLNDSNFDDRDLSMPGWIGLSKEDISDYE